MAEKITGDEIFVQESGTRIRTRCPKENVTDATVSWAAYYAKLDVGDPILLQCMNHEKDTVLWQRRYIVVRRRDYLKQTQNDRGDINHQTAYSVTVLPEGDWWQPVSSSAEVKWNVGSKTFDVKKDGEIIASVPDKAQAQDIAAKAA